MAAKGPTNLKRYVRAVSGFVLLTSIGPAIADDSYGAPAYLLTAGGLSPLE